MDTSAGCRRDGWSREVSHSAEWWVTSGSQGKRFFAYRSTLPPLQNIMVMRISLFVQPILKEGYTQSHLLLFLKKLCLLLALILLVYAKFLGTILYMYDLQDSTHMITMLLWSSSILMFLDIVAGHSIVLRRTTLRQDVCYWVERLLSFGREKEFPMRRS